MRRRASVWTAILLTACASAPREPGPPAIPAPTSLFEFRSDFWVNLHHFLYVRSRVSRGLDAGRGALAGVAADTAGAGAMPDDARRGWARASAAYDSLFARRDITFDSSSIDLFYALAGRAAAPLDDPSWDASAWRSAVRRALTDAAPAYRAVWWARHDSANRALIAALGPLLARHGDTLARQLARAYRDPWPTEPMRVEVVAYTQWAGAYSLDGPPLLAMSSRYAAHAGTLGLEALFHEASHTLMDSVDASLRRTVAARGKRLRDLGGFDVEHALLFYTVGEVVRRTIPAHTPTFAEMRGMWTPPSGGFARYHDALVAHWQPYLDGRTTFDEAIAGYVDALNAPPTTPP